MRLSSEINVLYFFNHGSHQFDAKTLEDYSSLQQRQNVCYSFVIWSQQNALQDHHVSLVVYYELLNKPAVIIHHTNLFCS